MAGHHSRFTEGEESTSPPPASIILSSSPPPASYYPPYSSSPPATKPKKRTKRTSDTSAQAQYQHHQKPMYHEQAALEMPSEGAPSSRSRSQPRSRPPRPAAAGAAAIAATNFPPPARTRNRTDSNLSDSGFSSNSTASSMSAASSSISNNTYALSRGYESPDTSEEADEAVTPPPMLESKQIPGGGYYDARGVPTHQAPSPPPRAPKRAPTVKTSFSEILEDTYVFDPSIYDGRDDDDEDYDYDENGHRIHHSRRRRAQKQRAAQQQQEPGSLQRTKTERFRSLFHRTARGPEERLSREARFADY